MSYYQGNNGINLDLPSQVEFNRRKNVTQDEQLLALQDNVNELLARNPAGFLSQVYYGLTQGSQVYRFEKNATFTISSLPGQAGDSYSITSGTQVVAYIPAVAINISDEDNQNLIKIISKGDYPVETSTFNITNMRTGDVLQNVTLTGAITLQNASYLGDFDADDYKNKQITVLNDLELSETNVIFVSLDLNSDDDWNWVKVGTLLNGKDGYSCFAITESTATSVLSAVKVGDILIAGETFDYGEYSFEIGDVNTILALTPTMVLQSKGNVRGPQGETGAQGNPGQNGTNGYTPYIQDGNWYINGVDTGVQALGQDGSDGQDGQSFAMQSGLYSTPANYGETGNVGPASETLQELPTLPQSDITGKGYVVYDPLTTPLAPYYDLYYANNGDVSWTIIHPYSGIKGQDGTDGYTPYIQSGNWYINGVDTGVPATGPQGNTGAGILSMNYEGEWQLANPYNQFDVVYVDLTERTYYICKTTISASSASPATDTTNWQEMFAVPLPSGGGATAHIYTNTTLADHLQEIANNNVETIKFTPSGTIAAPTTKKYEITFETGGTMTSSATIASNIIGGLSSSHTLSLNFIPKTDSGSSKTFYAPPIMSNQLNLALGFELVVDTSSSIFKLYPIAPIPQQGTTGTSLPQTIILYTFGAYGPNAGIGATSLSSLILYY